MAARRTPMAPGQLRIEALDDTVSAPARSPREDMERRRAVLVDVAVHETSKPHVLRVSVPTRRAGTVTRDDGEVRALTGSIFLHDSCVTINARQPEEGVTLGVAHLMGDHTYHTSYLSPRDGSRSWCDLTGWQLRSENERYGRPADARLEREAEEALAREAQPTLFDEMGRKEPPLDVTSGNAEAACQPHQPDV